MKILYNLGLLLWLFGIVSLLFLFPDFLQARNISTYSDTISDSHPSSYANHTFEFTSLTAINPGGTLTFDFPADFIIRNSTTTFNAKNVELYDDGIARTASSVLSATLDRVDIVSGAGGSITYTLNSSSGIAADSKLRLLVGNYTSNAFPGGFVYSTTTGTTTLPADVLPIKNSSSTGTHEIDLAITGSDELANTSFIIAMIEQVGVGPADTTETIPPYRFNPAPTSTVGGTTLNVEISLETDELAVCKYDAVAGTAYSAMSTTFDTTGKIVHSSVVPVVQGALNTYYVRCIDDEGNFNTDDFIIAFSVNDQPTGTANEEGDVDGDGTGSGNSGSGSGSGSGGTSGSASGGSPSTGGSSGGGGSGGGANGTRGDDNEDDSGGGFESSDDVYRSGDAEVVISGYAFPGSTVYALVDGAVAKTAQTNSQGSYSVTLEEIARGVYTFGIYAIDADGTKSTTFSTSFTVTGGRTSELSNVNIMPSISVDPDPVDPGEALTISGYSLPDATLTIENMKEGSSQSLKTFTANSDGSGEWTLDVDTSLFSEGTYKVRAKAEQTAGVGIATNFSDYTFYGVGQTADVPLNADLNTDGNVNLTDFSILLFWWGSDGGDSNPPADINRDVNVNLTDFSIMLFQWTG